MDALKECDLILLVINPGQPDFRAEVELLSTARDLDKQVLVLFNLFDEADRVKIASAYSAIDLLKFYLPLTLHANVPDERAGLIEFILKEYRSKRILMELLPFVKRDENYILVIPMDVETPQGRFLRPQQMVAEYITRKFAYPSCFRLDLEKARDRDRSAKEKRRFLEHIEGFRKRPKGIITDSQAMDILSQWCPGDIALTTFSITMIQYMSKGRLFDFVRGLEEMERLLPGDKILIVEACNHSRIGEDIGTVQIPKYFAEYYPGVLLEHNFGREFQENENLSTYRLIIHCGGCMITPQKMSARIRDLNAVGIPYTNYGLLLSYVQGKNALYKVLQPWGILMESTIKCSA